jgi:lipopolysaccharide export system ATP-binding protein
MHKRARLGMGYLTQNPPSFANSPSNRISSRSSRPAGINSAERKLRLKYLLDELDLTPLAKSKAYM